MKLLFWTSCRSISENENKKISLSNPHPLSCHPAPVGKTASKLFPLLRGIQPISPFLYKLLEQTGYLVSETVDDSALLVADPLIEKGLYWLWQQRDPNYGFKDFTANAITVLQLANATAIWYASDNAQSQLAVKQMEIELLVQLSRLVLNGSFHYQSHYLECFLVFSIVPNCFQTCCH